MVSLIPLLCAIALTPLTVLADEPDQKLSDLELARKLERLVAKKKLEQASALANETRGATWCPQTWDGEFRLHATLGVLARRTKKPDVAMQCAWQSAHDATTPQKASASFYEMSRLVGGASSTLLGELAGEYETCGAVAYEVSEVLEIWTEAQDEVEGIKKKTVVKRKLAAARKTMKKKLLTRAFGLWPSATVAKRLSKDHGVAVVELERVVLEHLGMSVKVRGPFPSKKRARAISRKDTRWAWTPKVKPAAVTKGAAGFTAHVFTTRVDGCDLHRNLGLVVDGVHYYAPVLRGVYDVAGDDCGGYGETYTFDKLSWVEEGQIASASGARASYTNTGCGPMGSNDDPVVVCGLDSGRQPSCVRLGVRSSTSSSEDDVHDVVFKRGVDGRFDPKKGLVVKRVHGPKDLRAAVRALEGKPVADVASGVEPAVKALIAGWLK